jgi:rubrerythrin
MKTTYAVFGLLLLGSVIASADKSRPLNPTPESTYVEPKTPEERRAYKVKVLEGWIAQDEATIANPGSGKQAEVSERVEIAKKNLAFNKDLLAKVQAGADHEAFFCSQCGREFMKEGTCPHCKAKLGSAFMPGAKRPMPQPGAPVKP